MVTIRKGMLNENIGFTLEELSICADAREYRMEFTSENSEALKYSLTKTPKNTSQRLQLFDIDEGNEITFVVDGYYSYEIFQTTSNNLVEIGLIRVTSTGEEPQVLSNAKNPQVYGS